MPEKMWINFFSNSATIIVIPCSRFALLISLLDLTTGGSDTNDSGGDAWCQVDRYKDHHNLPGAKTVDKTARRRTLTLPAAATSCSTSCKGENWFRSMMMMYDGILKSTLTWGGWRNSRGIWWSREPQLWWPSARSSLCCRPSCMSLVWRRREWLKQHSEQHHPPIDF